MVDQIESFDWLAEPFKGGYTKAANLLFDARLDIVEGFKDADPMPDGCVRGRCYYRYENIIQLC